MDKIPNPFKKKESAGAKGDDDATPATSNPITDFANMVVGATKTGVDAISGGTQKGVDATANVAEKGVNAVDPLDIFAPNTIPTRLLLENGLYERIGNDYPILQARSNEPFHDLAVQGKSEQSDDLVLLDSKSEEPIVVIERSPKPRVYDIYKTSPMVEDQHASKSLHGRKDVYVRCKVLMSDKELQVFMEGASDPTYTIAAPKGGMFNVSTKKEIKMAGKKNPVANTADWDDKSYLLEIAPGVDAALMLCLAIIADDNSE